MASNSYGQNYSGNDDFRGWLAAGNYKLAPSSSWSPVSSGQDLLKYYGNDGKTGSTNATVKAYGDQAYQQYMAGRTPEIAAKLTADSQNAALDRQTQAIYAQIAAQPKLLYRDVNAAWQQAQNKAASSVNPVYQDNLTRKLQQLATARSQQQAQTDAEKAAEDTTLAQTNEDIQTNRVRTLEDTQSAIAQSQANEANWQTQEGQQADQAETAARLGVGDQGQMGKGAGDLEFQKIVRNQGSAQATSDFTNERATKQLLSTRTFQDLDTKGTRATEFNTTQKSNLDRSLNDFITNQGLEENEFRATNESNRLSALYDATQNTYKSDTASWLASLVGKARSQDIALTSQVYG